MTGIGDSFVEDLQKVCLEELWVFFGDQRITKADNIPVVYLVAGFVIPEIAEKVSDEFLLFQFQRRICRDIRVLAIQGDTSIKPYGPGSQTTEERLSNLLYTVDGIAKRGVVPEYWNFQIQAVAKEPVDRGWKYTALFVFGLEYPPTQGIIPSPAANPYENKMKITQEKINKLYKAIEAADKSGEKAYNDGELPKIPYWDGYHDGLKQALELLDIYEEDTNG
jgi:hypothetical protein